MSVRDECNEQGTASSLGPQDQILTVPDVARELRCSKAHVYQVIRGRVRGVSRLPAITMGRRRLVRRSSLETWKRGNESDGATLVTAHSTETV